MSNIYAICPASPDQEHVWVVIQIIGRPTPIRLCEYCGKHPTDVLVAVAGDSRWAP